MDLILLLKETFNERLSKLSKFSFFQTRFLFLNPFIFPPDSSGHSILEHPLKVKSQAWYGKFQKQTWLQSLETIDLISSQRKAAYTHKEKQHPNATCLKCQMDSTGHQSALQKGNGPCKPTLLTVLCPPDSSHWLFLLSLFTASLAFLASQCRNALGLAMGLFSSIFTFPALGNLSRLHDFKCFLYTANCQISLSIPDSSLNNWVVQSTISLIEPHRCFTNISSLTYEN